MYLQALLSSGQEISSNQLLPALGRYVLRIMLLRDDTQTRALSLVSYQIVCHWNIVVQTLAYRLRVQITREPRRHLIFGLMLLDGTANPSVSSVQITGPLNHFDSCPGYSETCTHVMLSQQWVVGRKIQVGICSRIIFRNLGRLVVVTQCLSRYLPEVPTQVGRYGSKPILDYLGTCQ